MWVNKECGNNSGEIYVVFLKSSPPLVVLTKKPSITWSKCWKQHGFLKKGEYTFSPLKKGDYTVSRDSVRAALLFILVLEPTCSGAYCQKSFSVAVSGKNQHSNIFQVAIYIRDIKAFSALSRLCLI